MIATLSWVFARYGEPRSANPEDAAYTLLKRGIKLEAEHHWKNALATYLEVVAGYPTTLAALDAQINSAALQEKLQ